MIGLIVTGHGNFATGLTSSLNLIAGNPKAYQAIDFLEKYSVEDLEVELEKAIQELHDCKGIIILSDLAGGSPFKTAVTVGYPKGNIEVIAGTNLPMLIEVNMAREFVDDLTQLTEMAINTGKDQVVRYEFVAVKQETSEDGI